MDELLLRRAQRGDPEAFEQLIGPLEQRIWRICWHYTGNREAAEDCGQEAMIRIWRNMDSYRGDCALESWVYRIAVNCAFDLLRDRKRQAEAGRQYAEAAVQKGSVDETRLAALEHAVSELPVIYREAVVWGCLSDLSGKEAATRLGCTENTLYQRVFKAKQLLKKKMTQKEAR